MNFILHLVSFGALTLAPITTASPVQAATTTKRCVELQVPVPVVATNYHYTQPRVDSSIDAIDWTVNVTTWSTRNASDRVTGPVHIDRTFSINAELCVPLQKGTKGDILQIATPGLAFDKRSAP